TARSCSTRPAAPAPVRSTRTLPTARSASSTDHWGPAAPQAARGSRAATHGGRRARTTDRSAPRSSAGQPNSWRSPWPGNPTATAAGRAAGFGPAAPNRIWRNFMTPPTEALPAPSSPAPGPACDAPGRFIDPVAGRTDKPAAPPPPPSTEPPDTILVPVPEPAPAPAPAPTQPAVGPPQPNPGGGGGPRPGGPRLDR